MLASRAAIKPKLSLSISTATQAPRPALSINPRSPVTPMAPLRSPMSPLPLSPTARNTKLNQRGFSTLQAPTYSYSNSSTSRSILKKAPSSTAARRQLQFSDNPVIHCVTPIEDADYYGGYQKMTREERRWMKR